VPCATQRGPVVLCRPRVVAVLMMRCARVDCRRLRGAFVPRRGDAAGGADSSSTSAGLNDGGVAQLVAMGYSHEQASYAMLKAGGDVGTAIALLSGEST
jgi:hypothetical protein